MGLLMMLFSLGFQCLFFGWLIELYGVIKIRRLGGATRFVTSWFPPLAAVTVLWVSGLIFAWDSVEYNFVMGLVVGSCATGFGIARAVKQWDRPRDPAHLGP